MLRTALLLLAVASLNFNAVAVKTTSKNITDALLCPKFNFKIGDKKIYKFDDLAKYFAYYSLVPKLHTSELVMFEAVGAPCHSFGTNMTFFMRAGTVDLRSFKNAFQHVTYKFLGKLFTKSPPRRILDLGAHTGMTTMYFATNFPKAEVVAVEPGLTSFGLLSLNTAQFSNVFVEYGAAWDKVGTVKLTEKNTKGKNLWTRFFEDVYDLTTGRMGEIIPSLDVNFIMTKYGWEDIDFIKSDLEGAEKVVFGDARARETWLKKTKCVAFKVRDQSSLLALKSVTSTLSLAGFVRQAGVVVKDLSLWCRSGVEL